MLTRQGLVAPALLGRPAASLVQDGVISVDGSMSTLDEMTSLLDGFDFWFDIVTP